MNAPPDTCTLPPGSRPVLISDPSADCRHVYGALLRHRGYKVLEAADGESCLALAQRELPDIAIMELRMPGLSAVDVVRQLKEGAATEQILVAAVTTSVLPDDRTRALGAGFDAVFHKPLSPTLLISELSVLYARAQAARNAARASREQVESARGTFRSARERFRRLESGCCTMEGPHPNGAGPPI